jgi:hypothetical protein
MRHGDVERVVGDDVENAKHERASGGTDGFLQAAAVLKRRLSWPEPPPDPLDAIAPPLRPASPDVPPMFAASAYERGGAHASGQPTGQV